MKREDLIGQIFGRLTVLKYYGIRCGRVHWICLCVCGNTTVVSALNLKQEAIKSCGCLKKEIVNALLSENLVHGFAIGNACQKRFYGIWKNMKARCLNPNNPNFFRYGGDGISVCTSWLDFENFKKDMWQSYIKHVEEFGNRDTSLDRFPNQSGGYEPANCRWATEKEQILNRRCSVKTQDLHLHNKIKDRLMKKLNRVLRGERHTSPSMEIILGCSITEFKKYIESKFQDGMTWNNHGKGTDKWELDHIIGCNNFDLSMQKEQLECFNYTNYQPLWTKDHAHKRKILVSR